MSAGATHTPRRSPASCPRSIAPRASATRPPMRLRSVSAALPRLARGRQPRDPVVAAGRARAQRDALPRVRGNLSVALARALVPRPDDALEADQTRPAAGVDRGAGLAAGPLRRRASARRSADPDGRRQARRRTPSTGWRPPRRPRSRWGRIPSARGRCSTPRTCKLRRRGGGAGKARFHEKPAGGAALAALSPLAAERRRGRLASCQRVRQTVLGPGRAGRHPLAKRKAIS